MKCNRCGYEQAYDFIFCPNCGYETPTTPTYESPDPRVSGNPVFHHLKNAFSDSLFLAFCILMTASCAIGLVSGSGFNIIGILITVFSWLVFTSAKNETLESSKIRSISGTIYASYIISLVASIILVICSIILVLSGGFLSSAVSSMSSSEIDELTFAIAADYPILFNYADISDFGALFTILAIVLAVIAAGMLIFTLLGTRRIHRFIKSVYQSLDVGYMSYEYSSSAGKWLIAFGVIEAVSSLTSVDLTMLSQTVLPTISSASYGVALIVAGIFINKHFANNEAM